MTIHILEAQIKTCLVNSAKMISFKYLRKIESFYNAAKKRHQIHPELKGEEHYRSNNLMNTNAKILNRFQQNESSSMLKRIRHSQVRLCSLCRHKIKQSFMSPTTQKTGKGKELPFSKVFIFKVATTNVMLLVKNGMCFPEMRNKKGLPEFPTSISYCASQST